MKVKIISEECIKPASPTPPHLKTYKLSFLDQIMVPVYVPMVLFYPNEDSTIKNRDDVDIEERSKLLKQSLSQTLSRFYPLAGKIKDGLSIDCNDEGVGYLESRVNCDLFKFLSQPDLSLLQNFIPRKLRWNTGSSIVGANVAFVQANVFECGGIVIGVCINHMVADGVGMSNFLKCWGDIARGCSVQPPDFITAPSLFQQNDAFPPELSLVAMLYPFLKIEKFVTKRFVFDSFSLAALKLKATSTLVPNPTRVEVVSALIWKCAAAAFRKNSEIKRPSLLVHAVNLRERSRPPFPECTMGNFLAFLVARLLSEIESKTDLCELVHVIREAKTKIKSGFLEKRVGDEGYNSFCDALKELGEFFSCAGTGGADLLSFTSWLRFGLYEIDFGWGKPIWVANTGLNDEAAAQPLPNLAFFMETRQGNGIEAWVSLNELDMAIFERDEQLLANSSLDPSPLCLYDDA